MTAGRRRLVPSCCHLAAHRFVDTADRVLDGAQIGVESVSRLAPPTRDPRRGWHRLLIDTPAKVEEGSHLTEWRSRLLASGIVTVINLPLDRAMRLVMETESAMRLLGESLRILARDHPGPNDADALFACLSIGMEKLLKLTLGLDGLTRGNWPTIADMQRYGHNISRMNTDTIKLIEANCASAANPPLVEAALDELRAAPLMKWVVESMSDYALKGRF